MKKIFVKPQISVQPIQAESLMAGSGEPTQISVNSNTSNSSQW